MLPKASERYLMLPRLVELSPSRPDKVLLGAATFRITRRQALNRLIQKKDCLQLMKNILIVTGDDADDIGYFDGVHLDLSELFLSPANTTVVLTPFHHDERFEDMV